MFKAWQSRDSPTTLCHTCLLNKAVTSLMGPKAILGGYVQSQMHPLKEVIDVLGILWGFHDYGDILKV